MYAYDFGKRKDTGFHTKRQIGTTAIREQYFVKTPAILPTYDILHPLVITLDACRAP